MIVNLQTEHHLELLSLKGGYRSSSESTSCQNAYALAHLQMAETGIKLNFCTGRSGTSLFAKKLIGHDTVLDILMGFKNA